MAKVGYIFKADHYDGLEQDKAWMNDFGCVRIVEELSAHEKLRPAWKQLINCLERGDEFARIGCFAGNVPSESHTTYLYS